MSKIMHTNDEVCAMRAAADKVERLSVKTSVHYADAVNLLRWLNNELTTKKNPELLAEREAVILKRDRLEKEYNDQIDLYGSLWATYSDALENMVHD